MITTTSIPATYLTQICYHPPHQEPGPDPDYPPVATRIQRTGERPNTPVSNPFHGNPHWQEAVAITATLKSVRVLYSSNGRGVKYLCPLHER